MLLSQAGQDNSFFLWSKITTLFSRLGNLAKWVQSHNITVVKLDSKVKVQGVHYILNLVV